MTFRTDDGVRLEGELRRPEGPVRGTAVVCHPHPRYGGSKDHAILWALRNELAGKRGLAVLLFNFRGVMGSTGSYGGGHSEIRDVHAAVGSVRTAAPDAPTLVCGWSFGANVALREALEDERVSGLALIGFPLRPGDVPLPDVPAPTELRAFRGPVLLIAGAEDEFCPPEDLRALGALFSAAETVILDGTNHYLWRREKEAAAIVGEFTDGLIG